jgi:DNA-binding transcriptional MerR regulator
VKVQVCGPGFRQGGGGAGRTAPAPGDRLLKIGQLAKAVGETVPTIRHWTKLGLLEVAQTTPAGYQLFAVDAIDCCRRIQSLKGRRHTLAEIRTELGGS